jgi:protein-L-isoaspartate(D-aspartate) O-methyltransferase
MFDATELSILRRAYARQVMFMGRADNPALEEAYASVPREAYLGPGPWSILRWPGGYLATPDSDPAWLYSDVLVGIVTERGLNNGQPSAHAAWIGAAAPAPGEHVVHVGAGVGYYSAIMGRMAGPSGTLTAIEFDADLAARAAANLAHLTGAQVLHADGSVAHFQAADVIYVNAGASRPAEAWLDGLREGGRLILPLTTNANFTLELGRPTGAVFRITRRGDAFDADFVTPIGVFPCAGARDEVSERALAAAFRKGGFEQVRHLRRTDEVSDEDCWSKRPGGRSLTSDGQAGVARLRASEEGAWRRRGAVHAPVPVFPCRRHEGRRRLSGCVAKRRAVAHRASIHWGQQFGRRSCQSLGEAVDDVHPRPRSTDRRQRSGEPGPRRVSV